MKVRIFCKYDQCGFTQDWKDPPSIESVRKYYAGYNREHANEMTCVHDYHIQTIEECRLPGCDKSCPLADIPYCTIQHMQQHIDHREPPKPYGQVTKKD